MPIIPKGDNFGNAQIKTGRTHIQGSDGGMGRAMAGLGREVAGIGLRMQHEREQKQEKINQVNMSNAILEHEKQVNTFTADMQKKIDSGEIAPDKVNEYWAKGMKDIARPQIAGLTDYQQEQFNYHLNRADYDKELRVSQLQDRAVSVSAETAINQHIRNINEDPKADLTQSLASLDTDAIDSTGRARWGQKWPEVKAGLKRDLTFTNLSSKATSASTNNNYQFLNQFRKDVVNPEKYTDLQIDDRAKLESFAKQNMKRMENEWQAARAENLVNIEYQGQDDIAKVEAGLQFTPSITDKQAKEARPTNPASAEKFDRWYEDYKEKMKLQPVLAAVVRGTPEEAQKALDSIRPDLSTENYADAKRRYDFVELKKQQAVQARESDPATWLMQNSEPVQKAYQTYADDPTKGEQFIQAVEAQKQIYNIRNTDVLPKEMANNILDRIENNKDDSIFDIQKIPQQFGSFSPRVIAQIQKNGSATTRVLTAMDDLTAMVKLQRSRGLKTSELSSTLAKTSKDSIDSNIQNYLGPAFDAFIRQDGGYQTINDVTEVTKRLAYIYANEGLSDSKAAQKAYNAIIGDRYTFNDTWRLPKKLNLDNSDIQDGANAYLNNLKVDDINESVAYGDPRIDPKINKKHSLQAVKNEGQWITNSDETGLILTRGGIPVTDKNYQPIQVTFQQLAILGMNNRSLLNKTGKYLTTSSKFEARRLTEEEQALYNSIHNNLTLQ